MEWNFTYENQEASSFLVYQLEKSEQLDTVGMGMLSNNQIPHILPLLYTQIDEERYLRYAIPGRIPLGDYLEGMVSKERLLKVLLEICDAVEEGQAYMLDSSKLVLDKRYIFTNVSTGEVSLVYLPVFGRETAVELCNFFREIIFGTQFDSREDCSYIATIINYLNGDAHFIVTDFKKLVQTLLGQGSRPAARLAAGDTDTGASTKTGIRTEASTGTETSSRTRTGNTEANIRTEAVTGIGIDTHTGTAEEERIFPEIPVEEG